MDAISPARLSWLGGGGLLLCGASAAISIANGGSGGGAAWAIAGVVTIAAPVGVGLYAWRRDPGSHFGALLVAAGYGWFLTTLGHSDQEVLYSIGRTSAWVFEVVLIYVLFAYPSGHVTRRTDRAFVWGAALVVLVLYLPTALLIDQYPTPSPFSGCNHDCPANAFQLTGPEPGFVGSILLPLRDLLTVGIYLGVALLLTQRIARATPLLKRTLLPVLVAAVARYGCAFAYIALRRAGASDAVLEPFGLVTVLTIPAASVGFLMGLLSWRLYSAVALERLTVALHAARDPDRLRAVIATAVGDPGLELFYADPGRDGSWVTAGGRAAELPDQDDGRLVWEIWGGGRPSAALVCDGALRDQEPFVRAVGSCALAALETQRLTSALEGTLRDVEASRARLALAADTERQRIERDLHDGAQQQLVTLRVKLELAADRLRDEPSARIELLGELGSEVDEIIEQIRSLAHNIYPPVLTSGGLRDALRSAALHARLPVSVNYDHVTRHPVEIESAVYFCCLEALQNAAKHGGGASGISIDIEQDDELRFQVADDGRGFEVSGIEWGSGLTNMRDRLNAVGGRLVVRSAPGEGTSIIGTVPLRAMPG